MAALFEILYEDAEILAINKPADLVCHPTKGDATSSLIGRLRLYLGPDSHPQLINRLDRETSGVMLAAKTAIAARELRRMVESRAVHKQYLAIVHGHLSADRGTINAPLGKDEKSEVAIKDCVRADGSPALTDYQVVLRFERHNRNYSLVQTVPHTGRKHQIRIHLAHLGYPIVGDKIYGADETLYLALVERRLTEAQRQQLELPNHALHSESLRFAWRGQEWTFRTSPEPWFTDFLPPGTKFNVIIPTDIYRGPCPPGVSGSRPEYPQ